MTKYSRARGSDIDSPTRVQTWLSCWSKVDTHSDVLIFHNFKRPSPPDVISCIPCDRNSPLKTEDSCPSKVCNKNKNQVIIKFTSAKFISLLLPSDNWVLSRTIISLYNRRMLLRVLDQLARTERTIRLFDDHETPRAIANPQQTIAINTIIILFFKCHKYNLKVVYAYVGKFVAIIP